MKFNLEYFWQALQIEWKGKVWFFDKRKEGERASLLCVVFEDSNGLFLVRVEAKSGQLDRHYLGLTQSLRFHPHFVFLFGGGISPDQAMEVVWDEADKILKKMRIN